MSKIEIKIISTQTIKPSSPTPNHLKKFNLSMHDHFIPPNIYTSLIFFYRHHRDFDNNNVSKTLKSSLSETLTRFYPLAGRIIENEVPVFIDCSDEGAHFVEAEVVGSLPDFLGRPEPELLSRLLPVKEGRLLAVQANYFQGCGGVAIGVSVSHTLADASTLTLLVKGWAAAARGEGDTVVPDLTAIASRFPAVPTTLDERPPSLEFFEALNYKTTRYVFDGNHIAALKAKAASESVQRPSSVEVVSGHIWMSTMRLSSGHASSSSYLSHAMNLRTRMEPPLSESSCGNLVGLVRSHVEEGEHVDLKRLVGKMRRGFEHVSESRASDGSFMTPRENLNEATALVMEGERVYSISSWCGFGFYENADFGWGRPVWISPDAMKMMVLMDRSDGDGVEAWLSFQQKTMDVLQTNLQYFLQFASFNPRVHVN